MKVTEQADQLNRIEPFIRNVAFVEVDGIPHVQVPAELLTAGDWELVRFFVLTAKEKYEKVQDEESRSAKLIQFG